MDFKKFLFWVVVYVFLMWGFVPAADVISSDNDYLFAVAKSHVYMFLACSVVLFFSWLSVKVGY